MKKNDVAVKKEGRPENDPYWMHGGNMIWSENREIKNNPAVSEENGVLD